MSSTSTIRSKRIADLIKRELAGVVRQEVVDPRLQNLSITVVDLSPDLKNAMVYFTIPDAEQSHEVSGALKKAVGFLRKSLASRCDLRYVPKLAFKFDQNIHQAENLLALISEANKIDSGLLGVTGTLNIDDE